MDKSTVPFETLKQILRNAHDPGLLNDHPWTCSLIVQEALTSTPELSHACPGQRLISALAALFPELQPANPPRSGKRLDPRWGEFGLLAALYFTPFNHGTPFPSSLMDAWGRIDPAILCFVYGKPPEALTKEQVQKFQLVGSDADYAPASTLSDWHRKGLQRFTEIILNRERFLSRAASQPSIILEPERASTVDRSKTRTLTSSLKLRRGIALSLGLLLVTALSLIGLKAWRIYDHALPVYQDVTSLQELARGSMELETLDKAMPALRTLQEDLSGFKEEVQPVLWLSPRLGWVPVYGGDLVSAPTLIEMAEHMLNASLLAGQAAQPLLSELNSKEAGLRPEKLTALLVQAQPQLKDARDELEAALAVRNQIPDEHLSPRLQALLTQKLDPLFKPAGEGLSLAMALPGILGAGSEGPKTYMLLPQNEDELRPTGGFITSVGHLVLHHGGVIGLEFESVDTEQEDWSKPYPTAPWQLQDYMNSRVLILRDANWFTDFPTTALWVEYLYAYTHSYSVDGIIAFDQHFLVMLLGELGPLEVEDLPYPITDQNVIQYMRESKIRPEGESLATGWYRKAFISKLANALFNEINNGENRDWRRIGEILLQALSEHHLLLQFDDPVVTKLLAEHDWDNAVHPDHGDFLMVTDSNIGFNKTNAVVDVRLAYDIDLSDISVPVGILSVTHINHADKNIPCSLWDAGEDTGDEEYPTNRCYWNYLRVYKQADAHLLDATPHFIPARWMLLGQSIPARVDQLHEKISGVDGYGTLLVVPGGRSLSTSFKFALPRNVLSIQEEPGQLAYHLKVQKQPGTLAIPITVRIHFPAHVTLQSSSIKGVLQDQHLLIEADLRTDMNLDILFRVP